MHRVHRFLLAAALGVLCLPADAHAGTYEVTLCTRSDGSFVTADRWEAFASAGAGSVRNECRDGIDGPRRLAGEFAANTPVAGGQYVGWSFTAPPDTTIGSYTLWRSIRPASGFDESGQWAHAYFLYHDAHVPFDPRFIADTCVDYQTACATPGDRAHPYSDANRRGRSGVDLKRIFAVMECTETGSSCPPSAAPGRLEIYSARVGITDLRPPAITKAPNGSLVDTPEPLAGERSVNFAASDKGGGIATVGVVVDGTPVAQRSLEGASGNCIAPYTVTVPCPLSGDAALVLDTATIPNGTHTVQASVTDAAGNETRSEPVTVITRNGSRPNGRGASRFVKLAAWLRSRRNAQRRSVVVPFGSVRTAEGRLTDSAGAPIAGAVLDVRSRVRRPGARERLAGTVTTDDSGRFAYRVGRGPSRTLRFEYKAYTLDPAPVSSAAVSLGVRAGLRLELKPRRVRNGQKIRFLGRLKGGPARKGTRVTIDVLVPDARRRVPIGNVKADAKGRFRFTYRFRRTLVQARYRFHARLVPQPGYPYRGATSRRVSVLVTP